MNAVVEDVDEDRADDDGPAPASLGVVMASKSGSFSGIQRDVREQTVLVLWTRCFGLASVNGGAVIRAEALGFVVDEVPVVHFQARPSVTGGSDLRFVGVLVDFRQS